MRLAKYSKCCHVEVCVAGPTSKRYQFNLQLFKTHHNIHLFFLPRPLHSEHSWSWLSLRDVWWDLPISHSLDFATSNRYSYEKIHTASLGTARWAHLSTSHQIKPSPKGSGLKWWFVLRWTHLSLPNDAVCIYYCWSSTYQLSWYIIIVGLWCYNQSGVTDLLIMRDPHYGQTCFKSVKTLSIISWKKNLGFRPPPFSQLRM